MPAQEFLDLSVLLLTTPSISTQEFKLRRRALLSTELQWEELNALSEPMIPMKSLI